MKRSIVAALIIAGSLTILAAGYSVTSATKPSCSQCHACPDPTADAPCLVACAKRVMEERIQAEKAALDELEETLTIKKLAKIYEPVVFTHKEHAAMALMNEGCAECHHEVRSGGEPAACKSCHEADSNKQHLKVPGLKGAYHQSCMNCHLEWSKTKKCAICHPIKGSKKAKDLKKAHKFPRIEPAAAMAFHTKFNGKSKVAFNHKMHADDFGLGCVDCHRDLSCIACHTSPKAGKKKVSSGPKYASCSSSCHDPGECDKCHPGGSEKSFDHAQTGWALSKYHVKLECRSCHKADGHYTKLRKECSACHSNWTAENFKHSVVGIKLDDVHADLGCGDCHADGKFDKPPTCANCHDETYRFPAKVPGKKVR